jgi:hypothetical protein
VKTFKDLKKETEKLDKKEAKGTPPRTVDIYANAPTHDAEGNLVDAWTLVEAGVTCTFLESPAAKVQSFEVFGRVVERVTWWVSFPTRRDLTPRHALVLDDDGWIRTFAVLGTFSPGMGGTDWHVNVYEVH